MTTANAAASFEDVVSAWDEPLRCQSVYGCRRRATWLVVNHKPCGGQQLGVHLPLTEVGEAAVLAIAVYRADGVP